MFAIIRTGGKQYKVKKDDTIKVEKLEASKGDMISIDQVLLIDIDGKTQFGQPLIEGAIVRAEVLDHSKSDKVIVFKKKRRQNYRRKKGHRQLQAVIRISGVYPDGKIPTKEPRGVKTSEKEVKPEKKVATSNKAVPKAESKKKVVEKKKVEKKETSSTKKSAKAQPKKAPSTKKASTKKEK